MITGDSTEKNTIKSDKNTARQINIKPSFPPVHKRQSSAKQRKDPSHPLNASSPD